MLEVINAEYIDGYRVRVQFNNGRIGEIDLSEALWGPIFEPIKDIDRFQEFEVSEILHTIAWENDADLAPEYLYDMMVEQAGSPGNSDRR